MLLNEVRIYIYIYIYIHAVWTSFLSCCDFGFCQSVFWFQLHFHSLVAVCPASLVTLQSRELRCCGGYGLGDRGTRARVPATVKAIFPQYPAWLCGASSFLSSYDPTCERCLGEDKSATHILCDCEAIAYLRFRHVGNFFFWNQVTIMTSP
jgi:hypothetical protein